MDRHERWVLEVVVSLRHPLRALFDSPEGTVEWFNRAHHGLAPAEMVALLRRLLADGLIYLSPGRDAELHDVGEELRRLIEVPWSGPWFRSTFYGLTAKGGAAWEAVARPNWNRYIDASFGTDPDDAEVICADAARAEGYVFSPFQDWPPIQGSVRRDRLEPWDATYWKQLPVGHRLRYDYAQDANVVRDQVRRAFYDDANDWFVRDAE
jgi:hypothetical protein